VKNLVAVFFAIGLLLSHETLAQTQQCLQAGGYAKCDQGTAYAECKMFQGITEAWAATNPGAKVKDACTVEPELGGIGGFRGSMYTYMTFPFRNAASLVYAYPAAKKCTARPEEFGWEGGETAASVNACHNGCMYTSSLDPSGTAGVSFAPTGGTCTESDAPAPTPAGDGGDPGGGDGGGTDPGGGDGGGDDGGGDGGGGTDPGGGDGGGGTGPGDGDGGGDDGGEDGGGGTGPGPGPGPGEGDGDGPGQPGSDGDALYESEGKTVEKLYDDFAERVSKAPIIDATKSFFEISVSASCPVFTFPATPYWDAMTFDFLCKPEIVAILQLLGWLLLAFAAFHAIKIALT